MYKGKDSMQFLDQKEKMWQSEMIEDCDFVILQKTAVS